MNKTLFLILLVFSFLCGYSQKPFIYNDNGKKEVATAQEMKDFVFAGLTERIKQLNQQLPVQIDEYTVMYSAVLNGTVINYNYTAYLDSSLLSESDIKEFCDEIKNVQKENVLFLFKQNSDKMPVSEWIRLYKELGIKYNYNYIDENRRVWAKVVIDFNDF